MLCPEVSNFEAPASLFGVRKVDGKSCKENIDNFYCNHLVSVVLPDCLVCPENITQKLISDCEYYKVFNLSLSDLIDEKFLCTFVKSGKLTLLSVDTRIDCDNCVGVTPTGRLILNINKDIYESLGLEGKKSRFSEKIKNKYIVQINLKDESLRSGNKNYTRKKSCLEKLVKFNVIIIWEPPEDDICPSSIAKYFFDLGYKVKSCSPKFNSNTLHSVEVPQVDFSDTVEYDDGDVSDFVEWLGMISISGDLEIKENYLSSYKTPLLCKSVRPVKYLQWRGFFSLTKIQEFIEVLSEYNKLATINQPWMAIYVQGFSDSPVAWGTEEHHYFTNGDNGYLLIFNRDNVLYCSQQCSKRHYKNKFVKS